MDAKVTKFITLESITTKVLDLGQVSHLLCDNIKDLLLKTIREEDLTAKDLENIIAFIGFENNSQQTSDEEKILLRSKNHWPLVLEVMTYVTDRLMLQSQTLLTKIPKAKTVISNKQTFHFSSWRRDDDVKSLIEALYNMIVIVAKQLGLSERALQVIATLQASGKTPDIKKMT